MRHIIPISGKDSLATALWLQAKNTDVVYEYIHNAVGAEPPEVGQWLDRVQARLGSTIVRLGANLEEMISDAGFLPSPRARYCTRLAKIKPMAEHFRGQNTTFYIGIRADETSRLGYAPTDNMHIARMPLVEDGIGLDAVYTIVKRADLMPPSFFWRSMFRLTLSLMGDDAHLIQTLSSKDFYRLFAWRSRPNCYFCFYQRQYEWVGLYEHHPRLFWRAVAMEHDTGADGYTWVKDMPLESLVKPDVMRRIKRARAGAIVQEIYKNQQMRLFTDDVIDELSIVSCGVFCGK